MAGDSAGVWGVYPVARAYTGRLFLGRWLVMVSRRGRVFWGCGCLCLSSWALGEVRQQDVRGQWISLPQPAKRVISLAPSITELVYSLGAGGQLVAAVDYSDYPAEARRLPRVGSFAQLDQEAIVALKPDLIIAWQTGTPPQALARLEQLGLRVFVIEPRRLADLSRVLVQLGALTGQSQAAERARLAFEAQWAQLRQRYQQRPKQRVFYQIWSSPLMTLNDQHLFGEVAALCGLENIFGALPALAPVVDQEAVLKADPDLIATSASGQGPDTSLDLWRPFKQLRAVRTNQLHYLPPDVMQRQSLRILQGAEALCLAAEASRQAKPAN